MSVLQPARAPRAGSSGSLFDAAFIAALERLAIVAKRARAAGDRGGRRSQRRGASVEFADHRSYAPGDDVRRIDWNLYGRLDKLFLKLYVEEVDLTVHVIVDASASMSFGTPSKFDTARRLAAALGYVALAGMDRLKLGMLTPSGLTGFGPTRGRAQVFRMLDHLDRAAAGGDADLGDLLLERPPMVGGVTVLISDFLTPTGCAAAVRRYMAAKQRVVCLQVLAPEEISPEIYGDFTLEDSESGATVDVTSGPRALEAYRRSLGKLEAELAGLSRHGPCSYLLVRSDVDVVDFCLRELPRAWVVR